MLADAASHKRIFILEKDRPAVRPILFAALLFGGMIRYAFLLPVEAAVVVTDFFIPVTCKKEGGRLAQGEDNEPLQIE